MTDTTAVDPPPGPGSEGPEAIAGTVPDVPADEHLAIGDSIGTGAHDPLKDRLLLPLLVPVLSAAAVGMLAVNISRVFLAGNSEAALITAIIVVLSILGGASLISAAPRLRTSSLAMITGLVFVIIVSAGLLTLGPSLGHEEGEGGGYVEPAGPPVATFEVVADANLAFNGQDNGEFTTTAGINEVVLSGSNGHTFAFREPEFSGFILGPTPNPPLRGKVELAAGETYEFYCTIPGHAAGGMQGTLAAT